MRWDEEDPIFKILNTIQNVLGYAEPPIKSFTSNSFQGVILSWEILIYFKSWKGNIKKHPIISFGKLNRF